MAQDGTSDFNGKLSFQNYKAHFPKMSDSCYTSVYSQKTETKHRTFL